MMLTRLINFEFKCGGVDIRTCQITEENFGYVTCIVNGDLIYIRDIFRDIESLLDFMDSF